MKEVTYIDNNEMNILATAIGEAAGAYDFHDDEIYDFLEKTPRTSLVVEIVQALNHLGYSIVKTK